MLLRFVFFQYFAKFAGSLFQFIIHFHNQISWRNYAVTFYLRHVCNLSRSSWALPKCYAYFDFLSKKKWIKLIKELSRFVASISYTKGYFRTVMMLNFHAFEYSSGIAPSKVKKKNPNDLKLAHDMEWCHVPFAYQIGPGLI